MLLVLIIGITAFLVPVIFPGNQDWVLNYGLIITLMVVLLILAFFFAFEASAMSAKEIALIAMLGAISAVSRVPFAAIPSVQPCTFFIICSGYVFGPLAGFMVGALTALVSNFFLGQGPWTPYQMLAWGLAGLSAAFLRRFKPGILVLLIFGLLWGYFYGWIMNTWYWVSFAYPLTLRTWFIYQFSSIWFDTLHAVSNVLFLSLFGAKTLTLLERFKKRFSWRVSAS